MIEFFEKEVASFDIQIDKEGTYKLDDFFTAVCYVNEHYSSETLAESAVRYLNEIRKRGFTILPISYELICVIK
jgi:hypothetical protein